MADFPAFASSLLTSTASFLWSDSVRWIVMCCVLIGIVGVIRRLIR